MDARAKALIIDEFHRPTYCKECNGIMVFKGVGEYQCEDCSGLEYDDYGMVRNYLEKNRGANVAEISNATGVSHKSIREMIKEKRFDIIDNRGGYLRCEACGANISTGRLCHECELDYHRQMEAQARINRMSSVTQISASGTVGEEGSKRFKRTR